jgi:hypothetical protein
LSTGRNGRYKTVADTLMNGFVEAARILGEQTFATS